MPEPDQQRGPDCAILRVPGLGSLHLLHATRDDRPLGPTSASTRREHRHGLWHCVAYVSGQGSFLLDGHEVSMRSPWIVLTSPGQPHSFSRLPGENTVYHEVTFAPDRPDALCDWSGLLGSWTGIACTIPAHRPCPAACADDVGAISGRIAAVVRERRPEGAALLQGLLAETLLTVFRHLVTDAERRVPADPIEDARRFIENHAEDPIDLPTVARAVGVSPKHLGRSFAARYGDPPMRYQRKLLMRRAAILLRSSDASIEQLARSLGFQDWRSFSRSFRAVHGLSPTRYRCGAPS